MLAFSLKELLTIVPIFIISLTVHEFAHSFAAVLLGDRTSRDMGRFSLNPLNHIDPIGFLLFIIAGFGWAKPVMINRHNLKNPLRDDVLIALAGPASNFILAILAGLMLRVLFLLNPTATPLVMIILSILYGIISVNISLAVFNLIPIPPLDGSHIITNMIEKNNPQLAYKFYRLGSQLIIILIIAEKITGIDFLPIGSLINYFFDLILRVVVGI